MRPIKTEPCVTVISAGLKPNASEEALLVAYLSVGFLCGWATEMPYLFTVYGRQVLQELRDHDSHEESYRDTKNPQVESLRIGLFATGEVTLTEPSQLRHSG